MSTLVQFLQAPHSYTEEVKQVTLYETHISWVFLTGSFAYKLKKPVNLGFVDFESLEKRKHYCELELELNLRLAPKLYLEILPIYTDGQAFSFKEEFKINSRICDYVIKMHQFDNDHLLSKLIEHHQMNKQHIASITEQISQFHLALKPSPDPKFGQFAAIKAPMEDNFVSLRGFLGDTYENEISQLESYTHTTLRELESLIKERAKHGFIRPCHGDLHLGNMFNENDHITIFDCIEFNEEFRHIDLQNDIAFLSMDLEVKKHPIFAMQFVNQYVRITGDYTGLALHRLYQLYRAMVRAKVALFCDNKPECITYLNYGLDLIQPKKVALFLCHGASGSGKSYWSEQLAPPLNAIRISSDIERKRIHTEGALYSEAMNRRTYEHLANVTETLLKASFNVIVDATFLKASYRESFFTLAKQLNIPIIILNFNCNEKEMFTRIEARRQTPQQDSDATADVLTAQLQQYQELTQEEMRHAFNIDTNVDIALEHLSHELITFKEQKSL